MNISKHRRPTPEEAADMLSHISADCDRDTWLRVAMALREGLDDADGWAVFDEWSRSAPDRYRETDCRSTWRSLTPGGGVTFGSLVARAKAGGWQPRWTPPRSSTRLSGLGETAAWTARSWTIRDCDGEPVATHQRRDPPGGGEKRVWWERPDGSRGLGGMKTSELPLYRSERLRDDDDLPVVVVEGEKAADALAGESGVVALGTVTGASSGPRADVLRPLVGRQVFFWPDADDVGAKHMRLVARRLVEAGHEGELKLITWLDAPPGGDADDWARDGKSPPLSALLYEALVMERRRGKPSKKTLVDGVPPPEDEDDTRPLVTCRRGGREEWTVEAVKALADSARWEDLDSLYSSPRISGEAGCGEIVHIVRSPAPTAADAVHIPEGVLLVRDAGVDDVCARLDQGARWVVERAHHNGGTWFAPSNCTRDDAGHVMARYRAKGGGAAERLRVLRGVVDSPVLRADGSLLSTPGYDADSGLYADLGPEEWTGLSTAPTRADARKALGVLYDLVDETPFADDVARAVWASLVLSLIARPWVGGNVPLHAVSANAPGAGKGTIMDIASVIATGKLAAKWAPVAGRPIDRESEERKRLMAVALRGVRMVCIDNIPAGQPLGSAAMDAAITAGTDDRAGVIADRVLGESSISEVPWSCVLAATGNNLSGVGDISRRALACMLHCEDDPTKRQYRHHPAVADYTLDHRRRYLTAALTVLLGWRAAMKRGEKPLERVPSFGGWSDVVRSALVWAGGADPWASNAVWAARAQPEQAEAMAFFAAWHEWDSGETTVAKIASACDPEKSEYFEDLAEAVAGLGIAPPRGKQAVNTRSLGMWLRGRADRPGEFVLREGERARHWWVEHVPAPEGA